MKNLFAATDADELKARIALLQPGTEPLWGKMSVAQMLAHCALGMQMATGELRTGRVFLGRILGQFIKPKVMANDEPIRRNTPTMKELIIAAESDFATEQTRLTQAIEQFHAAGPKACTTHPHPFFGPMTPDEWAILGYKHIDHHLRQFGV